MQDHIFAGYVACLVTFTVPEFGTRARFTIKDGGRPSVVCAVEGDIAREFIAHYSEGDRVVVRGIYEPRPSTAADNTPSIARFRVCDIRVAEDTRLAA